MGCKVRILALGTPSSPSVAAMVQAGELQWVAVGVLFEKLLRHLKDMDSLRICLWCGLAKSNLVEVLLGRTFGS